VDNVARFTATSRIVLLHEGWLALNYDCASEDPGESAHLPVDGHVHFHALDRAGATLDAAAKNFRAHGGRAAGCVGALLLTQARGERIFEALIRTPDCEGWRLERVADEPQSLIAERDGLWILVVCGRQVRCETGLEVAALGTTEEFADGQPLEATIARVQETGALAALPWGFGKWIGRRGALVRDVLNSRSERWLAVSDNGGRLDLLGQPAMIRAASRSGYLVLPGTDPFPFGGDHRRVGGFGFFARVVPRKERPWSELAGWLTAQRQSPESYGRALGPSRFVVNQLGIQLYNRLRQRSAA
jgi:hypothetical protein